MSKKNSVNEMFSTLGAVQTLVENFPMRLMSFGGTNFSCSFDVLTILFKMLGVDRGELIEHVTDFLCGKSDNGFIDKVEKLVKIAIETNIVNILNCTTDPIISNSLLDKYVKNTLLNEGEGITLNVSEVDFTGSLSKNPFIDTQFYFDVNNRDVNNIYKSTDFNAYLWYIINKSDKSQNDELIWDDRFLSIKNGLDKPTKEIIKCTYIDEEYPNTDKIRVQICGAREHKNEQGETKYNANYYKTRKITNTPEIYLNKTIFEFNHDFLNSIKLYDSKVIIAEIVEHLLGNGNLSVNLGLSLNESVIQGKIQNIISKVISYDDMEIDDCYFSFSNEEYNNMIDEAERNRLNVKFNGDGYYEVNSNDILNQLSNITENSVFIEDKEVITNVLTSASTITSAQDPSITSSVGVDLQIDFIRALAYPFIRPLFTPKVMFLLLVNKKIMGSLDDIDSISNSLMNSLFNIIKNVIKEIKNLITEMLLELVLKKLKPLLTLFALRLVMEALKMYKDLLFNILKSCPGQLQKYYLKLGNNGSSNGAIDNVNYAEISSIPNQTKPDQSPLC